MSLQNLSARKVYPHGAPGLPEPHADLLANAASVGISLSKLTSNILYGYGNRLLRLPVNKSGRMVTLSTLTGRMLDSRIKTHGPVKADIMVIGKCPTAYDMGAQKLFSRDDEKILRHAFIRAGFDGDIDSKVYVTSLLKSTSLDPSKAGLQSTWIEQQRYLLYQEILLVRPKFIVLQGADVVKAILGKSATLGKYEGEVVEKYFDTRISAVSPPSGFTAKIVCTISPSAVIAARGRLGVTAVKALSGGMTSEEKRLINNMTFLHKCYDPEEHAKANGEIVAELDPTDSDVETVGVVGMDRGLKYYVVDTVDQLVHHLKLMRKNCKNKIVAWDAEWQGRHPQDSKAYLRCIQFSYRPDSAVVIALTHKGGSPRFSYKTSDGSYSTKNGTRVAARLCKKFMQGLRAAGHFFNADLEWFAYYGLDLRDEYAPAATPEDCRHSGGLALELAAHAIDETARFGLDEQLAIHTNVPNYVSSFNAMKAEQRKAIQRRAADLLKEKARYLRAKKTLDDGGKLTKERLRFFGEYDLLAKNDEIKEAVEARKDLDIGYGWISDEALYPYGAWDAAGELRLANYFWEEGLDGDRYGKPCWKAYWISHQAAPAVLEINRTGLLVDRKGVDQVAKLFSDRKAELLTSLREQFNWPDFNPQNRFHIAEAMFGEKYNGYYQQYGSVKRCRPEGAMCLHIVPLRSTGKYPVPWETVRGTPQEMEITPSAGKQSLLELFYLKDQVITEVVNADGEVSDEPRDHSKVLRDILDYKFLAKAVQGILREPLTDDDDNEVYDEDGNLVYSDGVTEYMSDDGYCRTHITQVTETGRWKSRDPALQNLSKSRESDYRRIIGEKYTRSIRSIFTVEPGWFLVEADYSGAELMMLATMAQDYTMIDHCQRSGLDEDDPNYFDIHANLAVTAFNLDCPPTKTGLDDIGKIALRTAAKAVIFGLAYGQSPEACATLLRASGTFITADDASRLQQNVFQTYEGIRPFLAQCASRVTNPGWLCNMFGRRRRFFYTEERQDIKKQEREAMNAPIQGGVADAMTLAIANLYKYRIQSKMDFKIVLQIHDAVMLAVPHYELMHVIDPKEGVFRKCLIDQVPLIATDLDGDRVSNKKYYFNSSTDIQTSWSEIPTPDKFLPYGLDPALVGWRKQNGTYLHKKFKQIYDIATGAMSFPQNA